MNTKHFARALLGVVALVLVALHAPSAAAQVPRFAKIRIVNNDGPGEGFNDPTAIAAVGGNPGITVGAARFIAFQHAAFQWSRQLSSQVEIVVQANFDPLTCNATSAVLGSAGTNTVDRDFPIGAGGLYSTRAASTWYPQALANAIAGFDRTPVDPEIVAAFSSNLGGAGCLPGTNWYYGLDGAGPATAIDFVSVVLHELAHGLGFQSFIDLSSGAKFMGLDDAYTSNVDQVGQTPPKLSAMASNALRLTAEKSDPNLTWGGALVTAAQATLSAGVTSGEVRLHGPSAVEFGSTLSHFSTGLFPNDLMEPWYTGPNHKLDLAKDLLCDVGWLCIPTGGTDVVFILDSTGSTRDLIDGWITAIPVIADSWVTADPQVRFALVTHADFPFAPYGNLSAGDQGFAVQSVFPPIGTPIAQQVANLQSALALIPRTNIGGDTPESQYEAVWQVLKDVPGRDLVDPVNYTQTGEFPPNPLGRQNPLVIYHFTYPISFHDRDSEPNYPFAGSKAVAGRNDVVTEMATQFQNSMFFGLTFIDGSSSITAGAPLIPGPDGAPVQPRTLLRQAGIAPLLSSASLIASAAAPDQMQQLANASGGLVLNVGTIAGGTGDLTQLVKAINTSVAHYKASANDPILDTDGDGAANTTDNCRLVYNPLQEDVDGDRVGNVCDNCIDLPNPTQTDSNHNGIGNACEAVGSPVPATPASGMWLLWGLLAAIGVIVAVRRSRSAAIS